MSTTRTSTPKRGNGSTIKHVGRLAALLAVIAMLTAACGTDAQTTGSGETGNAEPTEEAIDEPTEAPTEDPTEDATPTATTDADGPLTVYSGRNEELVGPVIDLFTDATGIEVEVRYGDTAELAATILEEGGNSPADVYFGQDAGALGALRAEGVLAELPADLLEKVEARFRATDDTWVGVSGRARTLVYNTEEISEEELPASVMELTDEQYRGRVGWAPTNGSFQAFVTAMRVELGEDEARQWVEGMVANDVQVYEKNTPIVEAVGRGEIDFGLPNHYYLYRFLDEDPSFPVENHFFSGGDVGSLVNVAGAGVVEGTDQPDAAEEFVTFLLSDEAQEYFRTETVEYPLVSGIPADERLPALDSIETPALDLSELEDLQGTLELLRDAGALS